MLTIKDLRGRAAARTLFPATTLNRALDRLGFVQADPIRAPARAQDLVLRHRVNNYRAGDLERRYTQLDVQEDFFINYGFVTREVQALMHPRSQSRVPAEGCLPWPAARRKRALAILDFVRNSGEVHPQQVDQHFAHGTLKNYWGGTSNATTHLLDGLHYEGLLRVVRREKGIRVYAARERSPAPVEKAERQRRLDALADIAIGIYAPLPLASLRFLLCRLRYATPQWEDDVQAAIQRAKDRLTHAEVEGVSWYWPADEDPKDFGSEERVYLLTPFDPVVWDRHRFELLWGWIYRFEAYTPPAKRVRGYYAMPMMWRHRVIGWANLALKDGELASEFGYAGGKPKEAAFARELEAEVERMRHFLGLTR